MGLLEPLFDIRKIKTTLVSKAIKKEFKGANCEYDEYLDTAFVRFAEPSDDEFIYFLDRNMAIIVREIDNEIIGLMIEEYGSEFLKKNQLKEPARTKLDCIDAPEIFHGNKQLQRILEPA